MCTVVVRWARGRPILLLALRDESTDRPFDEPGQWWPDQPGVIGGRDRQAGGTWCATDVATGATALVLNRAPRSAAGPTAASRGVLPLLVVGHGACWPAHLHPAGMAGFTLLLATRSELTLWEFDGVALRTTPLPAGTHMLTAGPAEEGRAARHLPAFRAAPSVEHWQAIVTGSVPTDDPSSLLVRHETPHGTYATVFAQVLETRPGLASARYSRDPSTAATWSHHEWPRSGSEPAVVRRR